MDKQILNEYNDLFFKSYDQNYNGLFFHPEAGRDSKLNESLSNIESDINTIDDILTSTGNSINNLLTSTENANEW